MRWLSQFTQSPDGYLWTVAKSTESSNKVWQRAKIALAAASPESQKVFRALKDYLATQGGNPPLQFLTFSDVQGDAVTVPELSASGCTIYGIFAKKQNTATDVYFKINDHATTAGGGSGANVKITMPLLVGKDEVAMIFTPGLIFATGVAVAAETTAAGGADTSAGDGPNGFLIVG